MKRKYIKGFTLVELIVVLAILATLAAMLVPSLTGYIDKAKEKKEVANARLLLEATQATISELYALNFKEICNADTTGACKIVTPITNDPRVDKPASDRDFRYFNTYQLASEIMEKDQVVYIATLSEKGKPLKSIYYEKGSDHMLVWEQNSQVWETIDYSGSLWHDMYVYCGATNIFPFWNANKTLDPKS